jgi:DNA-binding beta-propeller fold protein YncE
VTAHRPSDGAVLATVPVGKNPFRLAISVTLGLSRVWVTNVTSNNLAVIDARQVM